MGLQHALAMLGGIVSVPLIVGGPFDANLTNDEKQYLISAGLISSGLLSCIQIYRLPIGETGYFVGTGLVSVLGTSFTFVPIARSAIGFMKNEASDIACAAAADCANGRGCLNSGFCSKYSGQEVCCVCLSPRLPPCPPGVMQHEHALHACMHAACARITGTVLPCFSPLSCRFPLVRRLTAASSVPRACARFSRSSSPSSPAPTSSVLPGHAPPCPDPISVSIPTAASTCSTRDVCKP